MFHRARPGPLLILLALSACGAGQEAPRASLRGASTAPASLIINPSLVSLANASHDMLSPTERENVVGAAVFRNTCALCHGPGIAGAPRLTDTGSWSPRVAQGREALYSHAIGGFRGGSGLMPAKGGNPSLTDEEVRAAVDFMLARTSTASEPSRARRG